MKDSHEEMNSSITFQRKYFFLNMCYKNFNQCGQKILTTIVHHQIQHEFCIHTHIYLTVFKIL